MADESEEQQHELVMPFVNVTSVGGPFDDRAYCAGWEMGKLDVLLGQLRPSVHEQAVLTANATQADLLAMKHGYHAEFQVPEDADADDTWRWMVATRNPEVTGG